MTTTKIVWKASAYGPMRRELIKETPHFYFFKTSHGTELKEGKNRWNTLYYTEKEALDASLELQEKTLAHHLSCAEEMQSRIATIKGRLAELMKD